MKLVHTLPGMAPVALILTLAALSEPRGRATPGATLRNQQTRPEELVMRHARGTFEVKIVPLRLDGPAEDATLGRMSIEKEFHGQLEATGKGQMLTANTAVEGSAAYVAIERVSGTIEGRSGTFALQHRGTMMRGQQELSVTVVPDSGTGELEGLAGILRITIDEDGHSYDLEYSLP